MKNKQASPLLPPPAGYITELARLCGCARSTVYNALRCNARGDKAEMVRKMYRTKYVNGK